MKVARPFLALACACLVSLAAIAQIQDGAYRGQLKCGPALSGPSDNGWTVPLEILVSGNTLRWLRGDARYSERATGSLTANRVDFDMAGQWSPGQNRSGSWRTKASLQLKDAVLSGNVSIFTVDGSSRVRDCVARVPVQASKPAVSAKEPLKKTFTVAEQPDRKPSTGATQPTVAQSKREGPLFSSKSQFLDLTSTGQFLELQRQNQAQFALSIQAVLNNDYGIPLIPAGAACQGEFEHIVKSSFGQAANRRLLSIGDQPPDFMRKDMEESGTAEDVIGQISAQRGGWCSPGADSQHPYLVALPQLLRDFDQASAIAAEVRRKQLQNEFNKKSQAQKETSVAGMPGQQAQGALSATQGSPQAEKVGSQGAQKSESFILFLKIAGTVLLINALVTIYLHRTEKLVIYMDYTDALMTSIAPIVALIILFILVYMEVPEAIAASAAGLIFVVLLGYVIRATARHNNGVNLYLLMSLVTKVTIVGVYYLLMVLLIIQTLSGQASRPRRKGEHRDAYARRMQRENVAAMAATTGVFALVSMLICRNPQFTPLKSYFSGQTVLQDGTYETGR